MAAGGVPTVTDAAETCMGAEAGMKSSSMKTAAWGVVEDAVMKIGELDSSRTPA